MKIIDNPDNCVKIKQIQKIYLKPQENYEFGPKRS